MKKVLAIVAILSVILTIGAITLESRTPEECQELCEIEFPNDPCAQASCYESCIEPDPNYSKEFCQAYCRDIPFSGCFDSCMNGILI